MSCSRTSKAQTSAISRAMPMRRNAYDKRGSDLRSALSGSRKLQLNLELLPLEAGLCATVALWVRDLAGTVAVDAVDTPLHVARHERE